MTWVPKPQRLILASLLADRSEEESVTFQELVRELERQSSIFSFVHRFRFIIAAFLCRIGLTAQEAVPLYLSVHKEVKQQKIISLLPQCEAVIALLLTLQEKSAPAYPLPERVKRTEAAYQQWQKLHRFLTNKYLMPVLALAANSPADVSQLVADTESAYQQLLKMEIGATKSLKTMQYAWLLTCNHQPAVVAGPLFGQYKDLFRQQNISDNTSAAHLLTLHAPASETAVPNVIRRYEQLKQERSFRFLNNSLLLRTATQIYLRELHTQSLQEQAAEQIGMIDSQQDLQLISDAFDISVLAASILVTTDGGSVDGGSGDGGGGCSSG